MTLASKFFLFGQICFFFFFLLFACNVYINDYILNCSKISLPNTAATFLDT
jgi:hypothetical protein